ncbi:hypothetical protein GCM10023214_65620 [Amycolatopsis dongchuanensis]|uniref:Uncharacterized protein n=1 Tax=Amycolatopsis dongchuanensis TaxID=1070866 RepID=A0ABP8VHV6_9PSEU
MQRRFRVVDVRLRQHAPRLARLRQQDDLFHSTPILAVTVPNSTLCREDGFGAGIVARLGRVT